jgi:hypothetical protein
MKLRPWTLFLDIASLEVASLNFRPLKNWTMNPLEVGLPE